MHEYLSCLWSKNICRGWQDVWLIIAPVIPARFYWIINKFSSSRIIDTCVSDVIKKPIIHHPLWVLSRLYLPHVRRCKTAILMKAKGIFCRWWVIVLRMNLWEHKGIAGPCARVAQHGSEQVCLLGRDWGAPHIWKSIGEGARWRRESCFQWRRVALTIKERRHYRLKLGEASHGIPMPSRPSCYMITIMIIILHHISHIQRDVSRNIISGVHSQWSCQKENEKTIWYSMHDRALYGPGGFKLVQYNWHSMVHGLRKPNYFAPGCSRFIFILDIWVKCV